MQLASLLVASCEEGCLLKGQPSGSSVLDTKWQIGTSLTTSVQNVLLFIFQETSVCNFCPEHSDGPLGPLPVTTNAKQQEHILRTHTLGTFLLLTAWCLVSLWTVSLGLPVKGLRQARTIA